MVSTAGRRVDWGFKLVQKLFGLSLFHCGNYYITLLFLLCVLYFTMRDSFGVPCILIKRWGDIYFWREGCLCNFKAFVHLYEFFFFLQHGSKEEKRQNNKTNDSH